jgi:hypothetical protein
LASRVRAQAQMHETLGVDATRALNGDVGSAKLST